MNTEITNAIYKVTGAGIDYAKGFVSEVKRLNPNVNISAKWIVRNYKQEQLTIISSIPLEQLILPDGYYGNALGRIMFADPVAEFKENMNGDFLNFNISESHLVGFVNDLREVNPNVEIGYGYDKEKGVGKVDSSIPLEKLNFPNGYHGGMGIDKDGYVGFLKDRVINYKINYELDGMDSSQQFIEVTQRYFGNVSYEQQKKKENVGIDEFNQINRDGNISDGQVVVEDVPTFESPKETNVVVNSQPTKMTPEEELAKMARENRKFTILQRERAMSDAQKAKNRSAIMAGLCILGVSVAVYFNGQDINTVLQHELNAIYSWEALGQYLQDLGPLTTLLSAGAGGFIAKYFKNSRKFKQAQNEFVDFNASLENAQTLGGNENAKSRWDINFKR